MTPQMRKLASMINEIASKLGKPDAIIEDVVDDANALLEEIEQTTSVSQDPVSPPDGSPHTNSDARSLCNVASNCISRGECVEAADHIRTIFTPTDGADESEPAEDDLPGDFGDEEITLNVLESMTVAELDKFAVEADIEISGNKAEKIAQIAVALDIA